MGAAGAGKTTIGERLAGALGVPFFDADHFHSEAAIAKMGSGVPLDDADRPPWLERLNARLRESATRGEGAVLACSALKRSYRQALGRNLLSLRFVYLDADAEMLRRRLAERRGHYMKVEMLESQLRSLEPPGPEAVTVDATGTPESIAERVLALL
jgi:gluconokinase